ncbi:hypothetical protein [Phenylobacterium sp.]|jgi:hypothetical protein|uniref:hypothetical protein n=1 Tax=Phenylobacterium sp. TaxID=1871053 RepID=UPI002F413CCE
MRPIGFGLAIALAIAALAPATVLSASKKAADIPAAARKQGMAEAPAVVQQAGLSCQVSDARFIGKSEDKKAKTSTSYYEVDCASGPGFIVSGGAGVAPTAFSCIEANTPPAPGKPPAVPCMLPGNADPKADIAPLFAKLGVQCTPSEIRGIGQSKTNTYFEAACQEGSGYVVVASAPFDIAKGGEAQNCLNFDDTDGNIKCTLMDKKARLAVVDKYVADAKNGCVVKDRRYVGATKDESDFFETSCADGKGYIYKVSKGALAQAWDCAKAMGILGGCTLTDAREAATAQAGLYTRLAKAAGSDCDVDKYAIFPSTGAKDVVELVCKSGGGGIGIFEGGGKGVVYDCGHALVAGYKCGINKPESGNAALTADLRKFDQKTCVVSDSRLAGKTAKGTFLMEVSCADGFKGYMIEYKDSPVTAVGATGCAFAGGCKLKGNT